MNELKPSGKSSSTTQRVERWVRNDIRSMQAYHVPPSEGLSKLDAMENPYEWDEDIRDAWLQILKTISLNRYPDASAQELVQRLRAVMAIPDDLDVMLGNGSDELIQIIQIALADDGRSVLAPVPSFVMYEHIARTLRLKFIGISLNNDFSLDLNKMTETIKRENPACVFIAYPNNPTGNCFANDALDAIINTADGLLVIDEAYHAFCADSYLDRIAQFENVVVMRTLSKIGLAGLRLGFLVGA
ncbi:MAG: aminotransferase class I/II-fold pyridoxal phosphate-dependent enzyme, partial [Gammaproteobacteria bacterium]|nr:aminotransferase class I/II-fold pyridoxal phosphate-dependent enzyme [Gammaproteobacteria bacterium]